MLLEALVHPSASFVTLTYAPENVPAGGNLEVRDMQLFLKRLRRFHESGSIRYFGVGEYGDHTWRPHYHLALYGVSVDQKKDIENAWGLGHVGVGTLTKDSAAYIGGYVVKKLTNPHDSRLLGRKPEFARMSLRPGIGAPAIAQVAEALLNKHGWDYIGENGDVPNVLRSESGTLPLGRYLRSRLRVAMNFTEHGSPPEALYEASQEMCALLSSYRHSKEVLTLAQAIIADGKQAARNQEARQKIYASKKGVGI